MKGALSPGCLSPVGFNLSLFWILRKDKERHCIDCCTSDFFFFHYSKPLDVENLAFTCELPVCVCAWRRVKTWRVKIIFMFLVKFLQNLAVHWASCTDFCVAMPLFWCVFITGDAESCSPPGHVLKSDKPRWQHSPHRKLGPNLSMEEGPDEQHTDLARILHTETLYALERNSKTPHC